MTQSQSSEISRQRGDVLLRDCFHEIGHGGIVAAGAGAKVEHRFLQIAVDLAGEPRLSAGAFKSFLMAAGADHEKLERSAAPAAQHR
jgi:hypothetical protein